MNHATLSYAARDWRVDQATARADLFNVNRTQIRAGTAMKIVLGRIIT